MTLLLFVAMTLSADHLEPGLHERSITVDDRAREFLIYIPKDQHAPREGFALVIAFHGGGSNAEQMVQFCGLNETADEHGFVVVYPNGTGRTERAKTFNGGNCCGYAQRQNADDVKFTKAVIDEAGQLAPIDAKLIYAIGMSNGEIMAYRVADEMAGTVAAIAPVAGPMGKAECSPSRPVPVCHFHGDEDEFAAYGGGPGKRSLSRTDFFSVEHSLSQWIKANTCGTKPVVTELDTEVEDGTAITLYEYTNDDGEALVVHYKITEGGHTWPGQQPKLRFLGKSTANLNANEAMWAFFQKHRLQD